MAVEGQVTKKRKTNNYGGVREQREDRLSSLSDDILVDILSRLPLPLAIFTGTLSHRWRCLWTNVTSINISHRDFKDLSDFETTFDKIMMQIVSPCIVTLSVEYVNSAWLHSMEPWLRRFRDRNLRELKVSWPYSGGQYKLTLPRFITQTKWLVSVKLNSINGSYLLDENDPINIPNLKSLSVTVSPLYSEYMETLIEACPSLEELSLECGVHWCYGHNIRCSNRNVRRLFLKSGYSEECKFVINAPNLEFLSVRVAKRVTFCFEKEPIMLREAKIKITNYELPVSCEGEGGMSDLYGAISNARFLALDFSVLLITPSTRFCNVTRLALYMNMSHDIQTVLTIINLCPVLDVLALKFCDLGGSKGIVQKPNQVSTLQRVLKRIEIETYSYTYSQPTESFLEVVEYLLSNTRDLEHFNFDVVGEGSSERSVKCKQKMELKICKLLYQCPMVSTGCDVEFKGRFLKMSRKAGPKAWTTTGEVIVFN